MIVSHNQADVLSLIVGSGSQPSPVARFTPGFSITPDHKLWPCRLCRLCGLGNLPMVRSIGSTVYAVHSGAHSMSTLPATRFHGQAAALRREVEQLAQPEGRRVGTPGHERARQYLLRRLADLRLEPYDGRSFSLPYGGSEFDNLVGVVPGRDRAAPPLIIGGPLRQRHRWPLGGRQRGRCRAGFGGRRVHAAWATDPRLGHRVV